MQLKHGMTLKKTALLVLCLGALSLVACNGPAPSEQTNTANPTRVDVDPKDYPALQSKLISLVEARDRTQQAQALQLGYEDGLVQIVIDTEDAAASDDLAWAVEALDGRVEVKVDNLIQAWVPVDALLKLARHPRVLYVRTPVKPQN